MIKLSGSVGRMGVNKKHDVALVQKTFGAIKTKTRFGMKPLWPKKPDGRNSRDLEAAIVCFQDNHKLKASGKLECTAQTMNALTRALPFSMRDQASVQGTSAAVRGPSDPGRQAFRIAAETVAKAPFPLSERKTLARAYRSLGPGHNICLSRKKDWVTNDGRFATELEIDGELSGTLAEKNQVHQIICRFITSQASGQGVWEKGNPNDLKFRSKRQLKCLKGLGSGPLSADDKKLLNITAPPREPILIACAKGCAALIRSGNIAKPEGKKEAALLIEAAGNANVQLGIRFKAAIAAVGASHKMEDVAKFVFGELKANISSSTADVIGTSNKLFALHLPLALSNLLNLTIALDAKLVAYTSWAAMVGPGRAWDFKSPKSPAFKFVAPPHPVTKKSQFECFDPQTKLNYHVDIWGNINYGFVGRAAGFTREELLDGAGAAQVLTILRSIFDRNTQPLKEAVRRVDKARLGDQIKAIDDPLDRVAVELGMDAWDQAGSGLSFTTFMSALRLQGLRLHTRR